MKYLLLLVITFAITCSCERNLERTEWLSDDGDLRLVFNTSSGVRVIKKDGIRFNSRDYKCTYLCKDTIEMIYTHPIYPTINETDTAFLVLKSKNELKYINGETQYNFNYSAKIKNKRKNNMSDFLIFLLIMLPLVIIGGLLGARNERKKMEEKKQEQDSKQNELDEKIKELESQYGQTDIIIPVSDDLKIESRVISFSAVGKIYITGNMYNMADILDYSVMNNSYLQEGAKEYKSKAGLGSTVARAAVGGVLTGGVGAVIGGTTGKRTTTERKIEDDKVIRDYSIMISLNDFKTPSVLLKINNDKVLADLNGLFNTILLRNKTSKND